jgi:ABC-type multidrug transport system permease subunit
MRRFGLLLRNEVKLFRTAVPIHLVAILQPTVMYLLMTTILVHPTFDMNVAWPGTGWSGEDRLGDLTAGLVVALQQVGSPIGLPYVHPILVDWDGGSVSRQVIAVKEGDGPSNAGPVAVQHYGLIDSNLVKNFRNRLTAAALRLWDADLGGRAVTVEQHAWLPRDVSYNVYFGMALLPMATFLAAAAIGAVLTAQEFELGTVAEYRLAPAPLGLILAGRLVRLVLSALLAAGILLLAVGLLNDAWPSAAWLVGLVLLPLAVMAGCLGILAGLLLGKSIPAFLVALVSTFVGWILGSSFGLAAGFGVSYERLSRLTPFTHAVELLFPRYYGAPVGSPGASALVLVLMAGGLVALTALAYRWRILRQG